MINEKQTAVKWLAEQMLHPEIHNPYIEQAIQMEKQQIIDSFVNKELFINNPLKENEGVSRVFKEIKLAEQYYNETYGKKNKQ